jgi:hypothetical protein
MLICKRQLDCAPESVRAIQNQANQGHYPNDQTHNNHYAQGVGLGFMPVIDGNDGVQQMIDVASMDIIAYVKLHAVSSARIRPTRKRQGAIYQRVTVIAG